LTKKSAAGGNRPQEDLLVRVAGEAEARRVDIGGIATLCLAAEVDGSGDFRRTDGFACHRVDGVGAPLVAYAAGQTETVSEPLISAPAA
jgi:hypothetical protein